jgi:hypothetical protein
MSIFGLEWIGTEGFVEAARGAEIIFISRKYARSMVLGIQHLKWLHLVARVWTVPISRCCISLTSRKNIEAGF